jgi:hypothetical protein
MKKTSVFFTLAVVIMAMFFASCQKLELATEMKVSNDGLFLKSAAVGETTSVSSLKDGKFYYPNNLLFEVKKEDAKVLNNFLLEVKDFHILSNNNAVFLVSPFGSKPVVMGTLNGRTLYDINAESVSADKLPFATNDYGAQTNEGNGRFNGLLKSENYVLAINSGTDNSAKILIYDLRTGVQISTTGSIQNNELTFKVGPINWVLKFMSNSPVGNIFEITAGDAKFSCYTLS